MSTIKTAGGREKAERRKQKLGGNFHKGASARLAEAASTPKYSGAALPGARELQLVGGRWRGGGCHVGGRVNPEASEGVRGGAPEAE